jgi:translation initiation factor 2B subunit (eIF-2B alpha/beta/delta family)
MEQITGTTTVALSKKTALVLRWLSQKSSLSQCEILTSYIEALAQLITEARPNTEKISLTSFEIDLKSGVLKQGFANLFNLGELPEFIQRFYACQKAIEDISSSGKEPTFEMLEKEGFEKADIEKLLAERAKKKV